MHASPLTQESLKRGLYIIKLPQISTTMRFKCEYP